MMRGVYRSIARPVVRSIARRDASAGGGPAPSNVFVPFTRAGQSLMEGKYAGAPDDNGAVNYSGVMLSTGHCSDETVGATGARGTTFAALDTSLAPDKDGGDTRFSDAYQEIIQIEEGTAPASQGLVPFVNNLALGGTTIRGLLINSDGGTEAYLNMVYDLPAIKTAFDANGYAWTNDLWLVPWRQGETDDVDGTTEGDYKSAMAVWHGTMVADLSRTFGRKIDVEFMIHQHASHGKLTGGGGPVSALAQIDVCRDPAEPWFLAGTNYSLDHQDSLDDWVHLERWSYLAQSVNEALAAKRRIVDGVQLEPMAIRAAWASGNDIILRYPVEAGRALTLDTTLVAAQTNSGFELFESDGTTPIAITGVAVTGANEVTISTGSARSAGEIVTYANAQPAQVGGVYESGPTNGPRGNLRDDTGDAVGSLEVNYIGFGDVLVEVDHTPHRWAAIDRFTVSGSSGEPAPWVVTCHTPKTLAAIASEYSLDGLWDLTTDADTARYNHATAGLSTLVGTPSAYEADGVTFASGVYIDTGLAEVEEMTLFGAYAYQPANNSNILATSTNIGIRHNGFNKVPRMSLNSSGGLGFVTFSINRMQSILPPVPLSVFGWANTSDDTAYAMWPRTLAEGTDGSVSAALAGTRTVGGANLRIGGSASKIMMAAVKTTGARLTMDEMRYLYRDLALYKAQFGIGI